MSVLTSKCSAGPREGGVAWPLRLRPLLLLAQQVHVDRRPPVGRLQLSGALAPVQALNEVHVLWICHLAWGPCTHCTAWRGVASLKKCMQTIHDGTFTRDA